MIFLYDCNIYFCLTVPRVPNYEERKKNFIYSSIQNAIEISNVKIIQNLKNVVKYVKEIGMKSQAHIKSCQVRRLKEDKNNEIKTKYSDYQEFNKLSIQYFK